MRLNRLTRSSAFGAMAAALALAAMPMDVAAEQRDRRQTSSGPIRERGEPSFRVRPSDSGQARPQTRSESPPPRPRYDSPPRSAPSAPPPPSQVHTTQAPSRDGWRRSEPVQGRTPPASVGQRGEPARNADAYRPGTTQNPRNRDNPDNSATRDSRRDYRDGNNAGDSWRDRRFTSRDGDRNRWSNDGRRDYSDRYRDGERRDRDHDRDRYRDRYRDNHHEHDRWDRRWRDNHRYDWYRYRNYNRSIFHIGIYYSPYRHWSYRRLSIGFFLDSLFYSSRYWIDDPWRYRLPEVYGPYRWVRYYDDVLLVDVYSGEVVDVIYDFFW